MNSQDIRQHFPATIPFPPELKELCKWLSIHDYPISGEFRLSDQHYQVLSAWLGHYAAADRLAVFGAGPDGSLYAIWLQDDGRTPIVHLGSEGDNIKVLAPNFLEFLRLLAIGYPEIGFADLTTTPDRQDTNPAFQHWVTTRFHVTIPQTGSEITTPAQASHQDFEAWVKQMIDD